MPKPLTGTQLEDLILAAASGRTLSKAEPWDYGWSAPEYRRSSTAAMGHSSSRAVQLSAEALAAFEAASEALWRMPAVTERYDADEFWAIMASLVGSLPLPADRNQVASRLSRLIAPPDTTVVFPVANVAAPAVPVTIGALTISVVDDALRQQVLASQGDQAPSAPWWAQTDLSEAPVVAIYTCSAQSSRATHDAEEAFDDLIAALVALQSPVDDGELYSLRGDSHRPGVRGLALDRKALSDIAAAVPDLARELGAPTFVRGALGCQVSYRWFGSAPFPLGELLGDSVRRQRAELILGGATAAHRRLRVAARWYGKAHWALSAHDAVLHLGIAFDAMLSEKGPAPGRALADRYALLDNNPEGRRRRFREFQSEFYPARSAVAHGSRKSSVDGKFVRRMAREVRWAISKVLEQAESRILTTDDDYEKMYEDLKWGAGI